MRLGTGPCFIVALAACFAFATVGNAQLLFHDEFTDADGTLLLDHSPIMGGAWTSSVGVIIQNNMAVFDPTSLNPILEDGVVIGGSSQNADARAAEGSPFTVPTWGSGKVIEFQTKLYERGVDENGNSNTIVLNFPDCGTDENGDPGRYCRGMTPAVEGDPASGTTHDLSGDGVPDAQDMQLGAVWLFAGGQSNAIYVPAIGNDISKGSLGGTYFVGGYSAGGGFHLKDNHDVRGAKVNKTAFAAPGSGEGHTFRTTLRGLEVGFPDPDGTYTGNDQPAGVEGVVDLSRDDGATWERIGRFFRHFPGVDGIDPDFPGELSTLTFVARGSNDPGEGEFLADFLRIERRDHVPIPGDMDHDGDTDFDDIGPFVGALNDQATYRSTYFVPASENGDTDGDDDLDFDDITGFVDVLSGGGAEGVPEPTTLLLVLLGGLGLGLYRWRTRK